MTEHSTPEMPMGERFGGHADDCARTANEWSKPYRLGQAVVWVCDDCGMAQIENLGDLDD
jgi:hypothetical protein